MEKETGRKMKKTLDISKFLLNTPLKDAVNRLQEEILLICPYDDETVTNIVNKILFKLMIFTFASAPIFIFINIVGAKTVNLYTYAGAILFAYIINQEYKTRLIKKMADRIAMEFSDYIVAFKNVHRANNNISQSLLIASTEFSSDIKRYAANIYEMLNDSEADRIIQTYINDNRRPAYIRMFVTQCYNCSTKGMAIRQDGTILFYKNLEIIRNKIATDKLKGDKKAYNLAGFTLMILLAVIGFNILGNMGTEFTPDAKTEFYNKYGFIIEVLMLVTTYFSYSLLLQNKRLHAARYKDVSRIAYYIGEKFSSKVRFKHTEKFSEKLKTVRSNTPVEVFFLNMIIVGLTALFVSMAFMFYINYSSKEKILNDNDMSDVVMIEDKKAEQYTAVMEITDLYKNTDMEILTDTYLLSVINERIDNMPNMNAKESMITEIRARIAKYQSIKYTWKQTLFAIFIAIIVGCVPIIRLEYMYKLYKDNQKDEIETFQTLILMIKDYPGITTFAILQTMESYSYIYKSILTDVINNFNTDSHNALSLLNRIQDINFKSIVGSLMIIEKSDVQNAFSEIENDIEYAEKQKELQSEISLQNSKSLLSLICVLPAVVALGMNFMLPFFAQSMKDLNQVMNMIEQTI